MPKTSASRDRPRASRVQIALERLAEAQEATQAELHDLVSQVRYLTTAQQRTEERVGRLEAVVERLAEAQRRTEERVEELAEAQRRTEERVGRLEAVVERLAEAQRRTEERVEELAEAQRRTEERVGRLEAVVERLAEAQRRTEERVEELAEAQRRTEEHLTSLASAVAALSVDVAVLKIHVASLRGDQFERRYRENAFAYFSRLLRRIAVVSRADQAALADHAADRGDLTAEQATDLKYLDLVVRGQWPDGSECALAVEVSAVVDPHDVERAARRAALLGRAGLAAVPVVAGERIEPAADHAARQANVWRVLDGTTLAPTDAAPVDRLAGDGRPGSGAGVAQP